MEINTKDQPNLNTQSNNQNDTNNSESNEQSLKQIQSQLEGLSEISSLQGSKQIQIDPVHFQESFNLRPDKEAADWIFDKEKGFLEKIWGDTAYKQSKKVFIGPFYYIEKAFKNIFSLPLTNIITITSFGLALFLIITFLVIQNNIERFITQAGGSSSLSIFIKDDVSSEGVVNLVNELRSNRSISSVKFISKEQANEIFKKGFGLGTELNEILPGENYLPASIEVVFDSSIISKNQQNELAAQITQDTLVESTSFSGDWVEKAEKALVIFRYLASSIVVLSLLVIMFFVMNTIRLVFYLRKNEIAIMQLVGARDSFVKIPFILGGGIQAVIGCMIGLGCSYILFFWVRSVVHHNVFSFFPFSITFLSPTGILLLVVTSVVSSLCASAIAISRFMNV